MSTLKVNTILSADTPTVNITDGLNVTGVSTVAALNSTSIVNNTPLSNRNKIINGAMTISQRGTSFSSASNGYHLDRFYHNGSNDGAVTISQSTTSPDGFANSYKVDVTTADTSIAAAQYIQIFQRIEAQDLQDLAFGTSAAKTITVSFYVRSNLTGTYTFAMQQPDSSYRQMSQTYTIDSADTWERKTFTIVGDTSGGINNDTGAGLALFWNLTVGSNYTTGSSSASFITYNQTNFAAGHTANLLSSTSNEFYLTGVQLELGSVATPFEHRSFGDELQRCRRYYQVLVDQADSGSLKSYAIACCYSSTSLHHTHLLSPEMRTTPTLDYTTGSNYYAAYQNGTNDAFDEMVIVGNSHMNAVDIMVSSALSVTQAAAALMRTNNNASRIAFTAEL